MVLDRTGAQREPRRASKLQKSLHHLVQPVYLTLKDSAEARMLHLILVGSQSALSQQALEAHADGVQRVPDLVGHSGSKVTQGRQAPVALGRLLKGLDTPEVAPLIQKDGQYPQDADEEDGPGVDEHVSLVLGPDRLDRGHREAEAQRPGAILAKRKRAGNPVNLAHPREHESALSRSPIASLCYGESARLPRPD